MWWESENLTGARYEHFVYFRIGTNKSWSFPIKLNTENVALSAVYSEQKIEWF